MITIQPQTYRRNLHYCNPLYNSIPLLYPSNHKPTGLLKSLPVPTRPWESVGIDFVGPLPLSDGYDYLMVVIDRFSSMVHLAPTTTKSTAKDIAWIYLDKIVKHHGFPESIVSDRDTRASQKFQVPEKHGHAESICSS